MAFYDASALNLPIFTPNEIFLIEIFNSMSASRVSDSTFKHHHEAVLPQWKENIYRHPFQDDMLDSLSSYFMYDHVQHFKSAFDLYEIIMSDDFVENMKSIRLKMKEENQRHREHVLGLYGAWLSQFQTLPTKPATHPKSFYNTTTQPLTDDYIYLSQSMGHGRKPVKIFIIPLPEIELFDQCESKIYGSQYLLERWFDDFRMWSEYSTVNDDKEADFVFIDHCAIKVYDFFNNLNHLLPAATSTLRERQKQVFDTVQHESNAGNDNWSAPNFHHEKSIQNVDRLYLTNIISNHTLHHPAYWHCQRSLTCQILTTTSQFGRADYQTFSNTFPDAIWITNAASSTYLRDANPYYIQGDNDEGCTCRKHCKIRRDVYNQDIVVPYTASKSQWSERSGEISSRDMIAFFSGSHSSCTRRYVLSLDWPGDYYIKGSNLTFQEWEEYAWRSKYCLVVDGHDAASLRMVEVVMYGCVPVIISNRVTPPLLDMLDWTHFSIFIRDVPSEIQRIPAVLAGIGEEEYRRMQGNLRWAGGLLDYYLPADNNFGSMVLALDSNLYLRKHYPVVVDGELYVVKEKEGRACQRRHDILMDVSLRAVMSTMGAVRIVFGDVMDVCDYVARKFM